MNAVILLMGLHPVAAAGPVDEATLLMRVKETAEEIGKAFLREDHARMVELMHPAVVQALGGRIQAIAFLKKTTQELRDLGMRFTKYEVGMPSAPKTGGDELFSVVPTSLRFSTFGKNGTKKSFLVAISSDQGKSWTFVDGDGKDEKVLRKVLPNLPEGLKLPAAAAIAWDKEPGANELASFSAREQNFKVRYPGRWRPLRPPDPQIRLALQYQASVLMIMAMESNASLEELVLAAEDDQKLQADHMQERGRHELKVAGAAAVRLTLDVKAVGFQGTAVLTVFTHQGIAYRVVGVRVLGKQEDFDKDYDAFLKSFEFLEDRKDWLARYEGKPAATTLLAGLASYELNRPRWTESTFDDVLDYTALEQASYRFLAGGAWAGVRGQHAKGDADDELEELRHFLMRRLQNVKSRPLTVKSADGDIAAVEVTGKSGEHVLTARGTVFVVDGLAAHVWMECHASQRGLLERDWPQFVRSFRLRPKSKPGEPPAYGLRRTSEPNPPDAGLAVFLSRAALAVPPPRVFDLRALAADGSRALFQGPDGNYVENLSSRRREPLQAVLGNLQSAAFSRDGKWLAYPTHDEVVVQSLTSRETRRFPGTALSLTFGPGDKELLVCTTVVTDAEDFDEPPSPAALAGRWTTSRLESIPLGVGGKRKTLIDFPLSRVSLPELSPDGKRLALVTNRDFPRTARIGGHVYVCAPDGSGLRRLTKESGEIFSVAWAPDGRSLFVVQRVAPAEKIFGRMAGDVYRVDVETGESRNLTRSGKIDRAWMWGPDLLLKITGYDFGASQQGAFRIHPDVLAQATSQRPMPATAPGKTQARAIARRIEDALGRTKVGDVVLTAELVEKLAKAFAAAVADELGTPVDFSAEALDRLPTLIEPLEASFPSERALLLGCGAYYAELIRKQTGADYALEPVRFGDWLPGRNLEGNVLVHAILPWSEVYHWVLRTNVPLRRSNELRFGGKVLLVYPPQHAEQAVKNGTPADYHKAMKALDAGDLKGGLDLLAGELKRQPKNAALAQEVIELCEAARMSELARQLTRQAIDAGNEVPDLLARFGDERVRSDPKKALDYYRKAAQAEWASSTVLIKLARHYDTLGQGPLAESCWRRAYQLATDAQRREIRRRLGMSELGVNLPGKDLDPP